MAKKESYGFSAEYERVVAVMCATNPRFYGRVGHALVPALFKNDTVQLIVKACKEISKSVGHGPSDPRTLMQRVMTWVDDGQVTEEQRLDVLDLLIEAPPAPPEDEAIAEVTAVVKRRLQQDIVSATINEYGKTGDFEGVQKKLQQARSFGKVDTSIGNIVGPESFDRIAKLAAVDRLSMGIPELDIELNGGMPRGCLGIISAHTGAGKSMMLIHQAAKAMRLGLLTAFATLELSTEVQEARLLANLTGFTIDAVEQNDELAREKIDDLYPVLGQCVMQDFPARLTTVPELLDWVGRIEDTMGYKVDLLVIDYLDKLKSHDRNDKGSYAEGGTVTETLRLWLESSKRWGWTASQPQRKAGKEKDRRIEADDLSDSQHKARICDLLITQKEYEAQITYHCPKFRRGKSQWTVGPLPHDWWRGRMITMTEDDL